MDGLTSTLGNLDACLGEIFNIGTDVAITTGEAISIVEDIIGKPATIELKPRRPGDQLKTQANIEKARTILGYDPTTTAREGLASEVAWFRQIVHRQIDLWPRR